MLRSTMRPHPPSSGTWNDYRRVGVFLHPYKWRLAFVVLISLLATSLGLAQP